ncbi:MAG: cadherin-like beta sandwich domain-containing protein, partial [Treponema sp.]|nr:cadherin-like beta sandwich domain-containing protein [Treponema sp.]
MKHLKFTGFFTLSLILLLSACSNLFENVLNEELQYKTGDDSLKTESSSSSSSSKAAVNAGLVVIKNSAQGVNQITYSNSQNIYYVGTVPDGFSDYTVDYTNGSKTNLLGIDDPVEFRCFANDSNASVKWTVTQIWRYIPVEETKTFKDNDGAEVVYRGISGQSAEKLSTVISVPYVTVSDVSTDSVIQADLPYGVSLVSCLVTADDSSYSTEYKILLTKKYVTTVATSSSDSDVANGNNVTSHGLVVVKATDPGRNAINYSSTTYEYEVGDSTGADTSLDLTGRDDPVVFKCFTLDENATLSWSARYIKKYVPVADSNSGGIVSQYLEALESPVNFDFVAASESYSGTNPFMQYVSDSSNNVLKSDLPYGVTEVYATITGYNTDTSGNLVSSVTQYKVTLTKRYIITTATDTSSQTDDSGLVVLLSGTSGNQISYQPATLEYTLENLTGANENCTIKFFPEEPFFTTLSWTAVQTQTYESTITEEESSDGVTYTLQSGEFVDITGSQPNLIENGTLTTLTLTDGSMCAGNLPYGTTVVTVTATSTADYNSSTTYKITLKKKRVATNIDIESASGGTVNTVTNRGLVVLSAKDDYKYNHIPFTSFSSFSTSKTFTLNNITAADNGEEGMKFRCYLADTDANLTWTTTQIKNFTAIQSEKTVTDSFTGTTSTVTYVSGQEESECNNNLVYDFTGDGTNNEITLMIPYGVTQVKAVISATNEESTTYIINLTRNITSSSSSSSSGSESDTGSYSLLESLEVTVNSDTAGSSSATLSPEFSPTTTVYTLEVDEEADSLSIAAVAQALGADISDAEIVTKYGSVPGASGMNVSLVGGTSRISFTVTDETGISRTYYIYVEKPADGDTTLSSLVYTPAASFANGVKGFTFSASNKGVSESSAAPYSMTLSADDRIDVSSLNFTATPNSKRTKAYYGISDSETEAPISWSSSFTKASVLSETVSFSDSDLSDVETANKVLWIKTVSDEYYHYDSSTGSYSTLKESDTTYHKVGIKKAGKASQNLTAMVVVATYEDGNTKTVLTQTTSSVVAYQAEGTSVPSSAGITTFADMLDIYFRPLNKDQSVTYTALNTAHANDNENTNFVGYAESAQSLSKVSGTCNALGDSVNGYYHLTIGKIEGGTASKNDLPNGTTSVTICGETYTFVKPDLSTVSYSVSAGSTGSGVDKAWEDYIYLDNTVTSINMNFTTTQQNESIEVLSCEQTAGVDGASVSETQNAGWSLFHYNTTSGNDIVKWQLCVGNAAESLDNYTRTGVSETRETEIPAGTTTLKIRVTNGGSDGASTKDYTFYIIRAGDLESRLYRLTFGGVTPANFKTDWNSGMSGTDFYYQAETSTKVKTYAVDAGSFTVSATAVSENATITLTKYHTNDVITSANASFYNSAAWEQGTLSVESELVTTGSVSQSYTLSTEDAGTLLFKFNVKGKDAASSSESSERNY